MVEWVEVVHWPFFSSLCILPISRSLHLTLSPSPSRSPCLSLHFQFLSVCLNPSSFIHFFVSQNTLLSFFLHSHSTFLTRLRCFSQPPVSLLFYVCSFTINVCTHKRFCPHGIASLTASTLLVSGFSPEFNIRLQGFAPVQP